jgi:hypothetical protein
MFRTITLFIITAFFSLSAQALSIDPANCGTTLTCYETTSNSNLGSSAAIEAAFGVSFDPDLTLYYKANEDGSTGDGSFLSSYSTTFSPTTDPTAATITNVASPSINCPECYLLVKDGVQGDPAQYLIDLGSWNGVEVLSLTGFWDGAGVKGSISNVAIWGNVSPVPVPAAVWLFGTALIGFIGFSRRTKV